MVEIPTTLTNNLTPVILLLNGELAFPNGVNSISRCFCSQNSKCRFIMFHYTNIYLCTKFGDLKSKIDEKQRPKFWAWRRNNIPQGDCYFLLSKCLINVNRSPWSTYCAAENLKPWAMLRVQRGDWPSKNWENLDSSNSDWIRASSSQRHTMWS